MNCLCSKRLPCPIHKDEPLTVPDVVNQHTYVVNIYHRWSDQTWKATVAKDALQVQDTGWLPTKAEAMAAVRLP